MAARVSEDRADDDPELELEEQELPPGLERPLELAMPSKIDSSPIGVPSDGCDSSASGDELITMVSNSETA